MDLNLFIKQALKELEVPERTGGRYDKSIVDLISLGYRHASISAGGASSLTKKYFPTKPKNVTLRSWLCEEFNKKFCANCKQVLDLKDFNGNKSASDGKQGYCKPCQAEKEKPFSVAKTAKYSADKSSRTPSWADMPSINEFYKNCPKGYEVDHIIPLRGRLVSGLHVLSNLQYLTKEENSTKSNKFIA